MLNGVEIKSKELAIGADATLFIADGLISSLEIWSFDGNYPKKQLEEYRLKQMWKGSHYREIANCRI